METTNTQTRKGETMKTNNTKTATLWNEADLAARTQLCKDAHQRLCYVDLLWTDLPDYVRFELSYQATRS